MTRFHVNLKVADLTASIQFYSQMFGQAPAVVKEDYAKWLVDQPALNFSIVHAPDSPGIEHLGMQASDEADLQQMYQRVDTAHNSMRHEGDTICCYAKSTKGWVQDPDGVGWEMFYTYGESETFRGEAESSACCGG